MNELYKHPYLISQFNTCMFLVISHRRKFYWLRRKIWAQNFNETMFTIFLQNKPWSYESYDWTTSQTTSSLYLGGFRCLNCYLSHIRKPGGRLNELDSEHPIQQELLLPKSPEDFSPSMTTNYVGHWPNVIHTWSLRTFIFFITT